MSALIEYQELIDVVAGTIAKLKNGSSTSPHSFCTQQDYELYEGVGPLTFKQLQPKVSAAVSLLLNSINSDILPHFQRFQKLWAGDWQAYYPSQSEADAAFCGLLAREGLGSVEVDMALRASALYRKKWEREDYRRRTISLAMMQTVGSANDEAPQVANVQSDWVDRSESGDRDSAAVDDSHGIATHCGGLFLIASSM